MRSWRFIVLVGLVCGGSPVSAKVFLLGDFTPIFDLTSQQPNHTVYDPQPGNQQLFLRFAQGDKASRVIMRFGTRFGTVFNESARSELRHFYDLNGVVTDEIESVSSDELTYADLLIVGNPDWVWTEEEVAVLSEFIGHGGNLLIVVEPLVCADACRDSTTAVLKGLGSSLRIGPGPISPHGQWALLAAQPFMEGIGPVTYGLTGSVEGGTPLMYEGTGLSMLSVDDPQRSIAQIEVARDG
jgi:hypothetical protein